MEPKAKPAHVGISTTTNIACRCVVSDYGFAHTANFFAKRSKRSTTKVIGTTKPTQPCFENNGCTGQNRQLVQT